MDERFREFRQEFSNAYNSIGLKKHELRLLLQDHLPLSALGYKHYSGMTLFTELKRKGYIEYNDVNIMSEIADVTKNASAKESVKRYKKDVGKEYDDSCPCEARLSLQRKTLYRAIIQTVDDDLHHLIGFYELGTADNFPNIWDLVFRLEKDVQLKPQKKLIDFANQLNKSAKIILLGNEEDDQLPAGNQHKAAPKSTEIPPLTLNTDLIKDVFLGFLDNLSVWVNDEGNIFMLKLLFAETISIECIQKAEDLFQLLIDHRHISGNNIDLIVEAISLCGWHGAANVIKKTIPEFKEIVLGMEITRFSTFRQNVIAFGRMLGIHKIKKICKLYRIDVDLIEDQWDLLVELDDRKILTPRNCLFVKFIEKLEKNEMKREANVLTKDIKLKKCNCLHYT